MPPMLSELKVDSGKKYQFLLFFLLILITLFRLFYVQLIELAPDEAYYWTWSKQLQWGYYDHPPLVAFIIWLFTNLAGDTELGVRLGWVIMGTFLTFLLYKLGQEMFRNAAIGFSAALLTNIILLMATGGVIVTPDGPQGLCWVLAIYLLWKAINGQKSFWYVLGVIFGIGLLSKYTMVLLVPCIFCFFLSYRQGRRWLQSREPYLALLIGLIIFGPVIYWNYLHDWVSFRLQLAHGLELKQGAGWRTFGDFWAGQAGVVSPLLFLLLIWSMIYSASRGFKGQISLLLLFWTSAPVLAFFAYTSLRSKVEANWPALAYFSCVIALVCLLKENWPKWKRFPKGIVGIAVLISFLSTVVAHLQPFIKIIPLSAAHDPTSQLKGWRILGERILEVAKSSGKGDQVFLLTPQHQLVGEAMFYTQRRYPIYQWNAPMRINNLGAGNAPADGSVAIFFSENEESLPAGVADLFQACQKVEEVVIKRDSELVRKNLIWKCAGFNKEKLKANSYLPPPPK